MRHVERSDADSRMLPPTVVQLGILLATSCGAASSGLSDDEDFFRGLSEFTPSSVDRPVMTRRGICGCAACVQSQWRTHAHRRLADTSGYHRDPLLSVDGGVLRQENSTAEGGSLGHKPSPLERKFEVMIQSAVCL